jgi:diguanylate cyclase (GGDEF)-like protein/PAS domain S-box-containing protein
MCICEDGIVVWINNKGLTLLQSPNLDNIIGRPLADFIADDFAELFADGLELLEAEHGGIPLKILTVTAEPINVNLHVAAIPSQNGGACHLVECQDISDLIKSSQAARSRELRLRAILKTTDQAVITINEFGIIQSANYIAVDIFGYDKTGMVGNNVSMLMPEPHRTNHDEYMMRYLATGHSKVIEQTREFEAQRADGSIFPIELAVAEVAGENGRKTFVGSVRDITIQKAQEERIRFLAFNDSLTGLPNRASFNEKVENALSRARRGESGVALMFIDLDKFKPINDTLGHDAGDTVLKIVAERLNKVIRKTDTAARLGGDEFVLILENIGQRDDVIVIAEKLLKEVPETIETAAGPCSVGISIGISHFPTDADNVPDLLHAADQAMYKVKEAGRNNYSFC